MQNLTYGKAAPTACLDDSPAWRIRNAEHAHRIGRKVEVDGVETKPFYHVPLAGRSRFERGSKKRQLLEMQVFAFCNGEDVGLHLKRRTNIFMYVSSCHKSVLTLNCTIGALLQSFAQQNSLESEWQSTKSYNHTK